MYPPSGIPVGKSTPIAPTSLFGNPATFTAAANTQAGDYDTIMADYANLAKTFQQNPLTVSPVSFSPISYSPISPQTTQYSQSPDVTKSLSTLGDLATTGGYSAQDIADIRARDISPIRSIYANAQQNLNRQRALQGGYSPSFNATIGQLSRDEAQQISDTVTNANAGIAQNVASNKIAAASPYASASATANAAKTAADQRNTDIVNQINAMNAQLGTQVAAQNSQLGTQVGEFNTQAKLAADQANRSTFLAPIEGMRSLYGTTPALTSLFGNQVMQANSANQNQQELNNRKLQTISGLG